MIQEGIENAMKKRKEKVDAWKKMQDGEENPNSEDVDGNRVGWSLEDENEDEDNSGEFANGGIKDDTEKGEVKEDKMEADDDDVDPLDAFMVGVQEEVKQINDTFQKKSGTLVSSGELTKPVLRYYVLGNMRNYLIALIMC